MTASLKASPLVSTDDFTKSHSSWDSEDVTPATTAVASEGSSPTSEDYLSEAFGQELSLPTPTLNQVLVESAQKYSDDVALISVHQDQDLIPIKFPTSEQSYTNSKGTYLRWTHGQLQYASDVLASGLRAQGVKKGMPIATLLTNGVEWAMVLRAAAMLGCPFAPLNPRIAVSLNEIEHMLKVSGARVLVTGDLSMSKKLQEGLPELMSAFLCKTVLEKDRDSLVAGWTGFYDLCSGPRHPDLDIPFDVSDAEDEPAVIIFTSGTTSLPKGAIHTNKSIGSSLQSQQLVFKLDSSSRICCHLPTYHIGGIVFALMYMIVGGSVVFPSASFDPGTTLDAIAQEKCTNFPCVPTILQALIGHPKMATTDTSSLKSVEMVATTIVPENLRQVFQVLESPFASNGYAMSEGVPIAVQSFSPRDYGVLGCGPPCPGARIRICAPDSILPLKRGEEGEIHIGGPQVIKSYLYGASPDSFYSDKYGHWLKSGDQGVLSGHGELTVLGRYKDQTLTSPLIIIRGGENIAPAAIEAVLDTQLGIMAQVVGVRSYEAGEVPVAIVQSKSDSATPISAIRKTILEHLGAGFVPEKVYALEDLGLKDYPKTASGKIRKVDLREIVQKLEDSLEAQETQEALTNDTQIHMDLESKILAIWHKIFEIDTDDEGAIADAQISDVTDSLTQMRFRNKIKRELGLDVGADQLLKAGTVKNLVGLLSTQATSASFNDFNISREGPPQTDDMAIALGDPEIAVQIQKEVTTAIEPLGFSWEEDVEDVIPSWDLGTELFGSVVGHAKVSHRTTFSMNKATMEELHSALTKVLVFHAIHRSFELRGVNGERAMRVLMRPNSRWSKYSISEIPPVESPEELVSLTQSGTYFPEVGHPFPSSLFYITHIKSTNSAGMIWAQQHAAFDGTSLSMFHEDLDAILGNPQVVIKPHIPYKLWAESYYLHRDSLAARRSVNYYGRKFSRLSQHSAALFPPTSEDLKARNILHRPTFQARRSCVDLPYLSELQTRHDISPFIVVKAALTLFLSFKTNSPLALYSQNENGRSWPFQDEWIQKQLPQCMDIAGPTFERTVQLTAINAQETVLEFFQRLQKEQDADAPHVHAPWTSIRKSLGTENAIVLDAAMERTCLNWAAIAMKNNQMGLMNMRDHAQKTNVESWSNWNCGVEDKNKLWIWIWGDEDRVRKEDADEWTEMAMGAMRWMTDVENWGKSVGGFKFEG